MELPAIKSAAGSYLRMRLNKNFWRLSCGFADFTYNESESKDEDMVQGSTLKRNPGRSSPRRKTRADSIRQHQMIDKV